MAAPLTEFEDARSLVLERARPLTGETVALADALDRVLAERICAADDVPAFDNSAMDGYAVRASDSGEGVRLTVVDESRAGAPATAAVGSGEACAISTGAAMPAGADAVVPVEETRRRGGEVELLAAAAPGRFVRHAGDDLRAGEPVLEPGTGLGPAELGVVASAGRGTVAVGARPRVGILTTGDELIGPEDRLRHGSVRNASALMIPALVRRAGGEVLSLAHARDDPASIAAAIAAALAGEAVVVTGGMSVGEHDHVGDALEEVGVERHFAGVALKPGKPFWFGTRGPTLVFGLPGNPVSSLVTFLLLVAPALRALAGQPPARERTVATLDQDWQRTPGRVEAVRCRLALRPDGWHVAPTGAQDSHILTSLLGAQALALIGAGSGVLRAGEQVPIELL
ncbi:MAG: gephyrin-like molybdotransferase Glp [Solirubrobacteraceae bacterium]|jgi:molybdopterin molybdotransferase